MSRHYEPRGAGLVLETAAAWTLGLLWILPLAYAVWTAFHPAEFSARFSLLAPITLGNFARAWEAAPFARYFANSFMLVSLVLALQLVLCTLAAYAFARYEFRAVRTVFDINTFYVCGEPQPDGKSIKLWAKDHEGWLTMDATAIIK